MAISPQMAPDQILKELKAISADVQQIKASLAALSSEVQILHREIKELPTGATWTSEKRP